MNSDNAKIRATGGDMLNRLYLIAFWLLVVVLLVGLFSCAPHSSEKSSGPQAGIADTSGDSSARSTPVADTAMRPLRLILGATRAHDSAAIVTDFHVDQVIRQVLDSIPDADYLTVNLRDSVVREIRAGGDSSQKEIPLAELGRRLRLDGVVFVNVARFGSVLAVELRIVEPGSGREVFRDVAFSVIRYREKGGAMLLAPALYDAIRKSLSKRFSLPHLPTAPVATEPIVISALVIGRDTALGRIAKNREQLARTTIEALGDYANLHFPELVAFDETSRNRVYETVRIASVANAMPPGDAERQALFNLGIDRFLVGAVEPVGRDSLSFRLAIRYVVSARLDSLGAGRDTVLPKRNFQAATLDEDFIVTFIDLAEPLYKQEALRIADRYQSRVSATQR